MPMNTIPNCSDHVYPNKYIYTVMKKQKNKKDTRYGLTQEHPPSNLDNYINSLLLFF